MATKDLKLRGQCTYAKVYKPDEYKGKEFWKINLFPDDESLVKIKKAGLSNKKRTDDGSTSGVSGTYYTFRRDVEKTFKKKVKRFEPPMIVGPDDELLVSYGDWDDDNEYYERDGDPILIGNGSVVEVKLEVYDAGSYGKGSRLSAIKLIDLIEYIPPEDVNEDEVDEEEKVEETKPSKKSAEKKKPKW